MLPGDRSGVNERDRLLRNLRISVSRAARLLPGSVVQWFRSSVPSAPLRWVHSLLGVVADGEAAGWPAAAPQPRPERGKVGGQQREGCKQQDRDRDGPGEE